MTSRRFVSGDNHRFRLEQLPAVPGEVGRRHHRHVQKLPESRLRVLPDGLLRAAGSQAPGHVDQDTQLPGHPVERDGAPPQRDDQQARRNRIVHVINCLFISIYSSWYR